MTAAAVVGIDLGTTHTVVAWAEPSVAEGIQLFKVPQLTSANEIAEAPLFPSALFAPTLSEEVPDPWQESPWRTGSFARERAQQVPGRGVTSSKSWLCHTSVDRTAPILPWNHTSGAEDRDPSPRISPVDAAALLLQHVRKAWDQAFPSWPLHKQLVVLTVPASFDEVARELTVTAATSAGLDVRLLEEPQAAFYDLLDQHGTQGITDELSLSTEATQVLVCDIGGGTTDLSLIQVEPDPTLPQVNRIAVGRHLLLGGDNMDLALAHRCEQRLTPVNQRLDPHQFFELVLACRSAKELLLRASAKAQVQVTIAGGGSQLVGGTLRTDLTQADVEEVVLDGFFPKVASTDRPQNARGALTTFGLPYERDAAITRHIAEFCGNHGGQAPSVALLNGGPFNSAKIADRLLETLGIFSGQPIQQLRGTDPDLSVARGAVAFGLSLLGKGARIGGGSSRAYYVALSGNAHPKGICVLPRGSKEGERHTTQTGTLALITGRPVRFDLVAREQSDSKLGELVSLTGESLEQLPPLIATFEAQSNTRQGETVPVEIQAELSAVGTVDLNCVESGKASPRKFRLAFDLTGQGTPPAQPADAKVKLPTEFAEAKSLIDAVFGKGGATETSRTVRQLFRELERLLGERTSWDTTLNRALLDAIAPNRQARKRSVDHERLYWMLVGFCLRPGLGHPLDERRMKLLSPLITEALTFKDEARNWQQMFIAWRRIAAGLHAKTQTSIRDRVDPYLTPRGVQLKKSKKFKPLAPAEMLEMAAFLERVPAERKAQLGEWILERTWNERDARLWSALGRLGSRVPAYASAHEVLPVRHVEQWLDHLFRERWEEIPTAAWTATLLARVTGDRARDLDVRLREEVVRRLEAVNARSEWIDRVRDFVPLDETARQDLFGEALPAGLKLLTPNPAR